VTDQAGDSDLRRRAAWLLALLAIVAALVVVLILTLTHTSGGNGHQGAAPDDSLVASPSTSTNRSSASHRSTSSATSSASRSTTANHTPVSCTRLCVVDGDLGNSVGAINDYRAKHGQSRVPGTVSASAQHCAYTNGRNCKGGWAESQVASPTGAAALAKIIPLGKLLDPHLKRFEVGWAYDPSGHQYYFAIVKHD
jgi:hypothetical protein